MTTMRNPLHPGEIVKDELIDATGMSITAAAFRLGVSRITLSRLLNGHANISPEMALRLSKLFGTSIALWINLQAQYDAWHIRKQAYKIHIKPLRRLDKAA